MRVQRAAAVKAVKAIAAMAEAESDLRDEDDGNDGGRVVQSQPTLWARLVAAGTATIVLARGRHVTENFSRREAEIFEEVMLAAICDYTRPRDAVLSRVQV